MKKKIKKLYLVKREVYAFSLAEAAHKTGQIYEISEGVDKPKDTAPIKGFNA